ncbi:UDP-4-amino-4-deoxy-L-arabinose--oxoglutarate aminotransferase [uncultured Eubacterium sp.]|nr:UDP-4-amino-4-deoxy-L-arabinose--oxoglutarate aminotransferase [uncultured Eubacterium sp.]
MKDRIFLASPHMSEEGYEKSYIKEAFDTNWIAPLGANVDGLEKEFCQLSGNRAATALSSGTAALHLALKLAGAKPEEKVFCQSLTFSATANAILYTGAEPVFIDSDYETWNMSPAALERAFQKYPDCRIVVPVHLYGIAANMTEIQRICKAHDAVLIEDAAESLGTLYGNKYTGTFGDYGVFSFNGNKIITTSGGGILAGNKADAEERIQKARFWSTQSREPVRHYEHKELGYNYRMSNICAGIGRGQLRVLEKRVNQKRQIFEFYRDAFSEIDDIEMMPVDFGGQRCNCWLSVMTLKPESIVKPLDIMLALEQENIESRLVWKPMHLQPFFADYDYIDNCGIAEDLFNRGVCLPSDTKMSREQQIEVIEIVRGMF